MGVTKTPTLWLYENDGRWFGHVDWKDKSPLKRQGPFKTEAEAGVVISRSNGMEPPEDLLRRFNNE
jgi:hypothetical protein